MSRIYVRTGAPDDKKFRRLGKLLEIDPVHAFGLAVSLWEKIWVAELWDARLAGWDEVELSHACRWYGDASRLADAFLEAGLLCSSACRHGDSLDGIWVVHDWVEEQGPLVKKLHANRERNRATERKEQQPTHAPQPSEASASDDVLRQVLQQMSVQKTQGSPKQKREHVEAWRARGLKGSDILELVMNNPGKHVFELQKLVEKGISRPDAAKTGSTFLDATEKIVKEVEARQARAAKAQNG